MPITIAVDYENNASEWWESGGLELWNEYIQHAEQDKITLPTEKAKDLITRAQQIPGWESPDYPTYASHPPRMVERRRKRKDGIK